MKFKNLIGLVFCISLIFVFVSVENACNINKSNDHKDTTGLKIPSGFKAEHLYSPKEHDQGSWVAMTFDDKGRLITSDQFGNLYRSELPPIGFDSSDLPIQVDTLPMDLKSDTSSAKIELGYAHGLLYAFNSLYVVVNDEGEADSSTRASGLYRLEDTDNDDVYDKLTLLKRLEGSGEHGPHSPVLSPDGESIYLVAGNFTEIPKIDEYRIPKNWENDILLPKLNDPRGFGAGVEPPGGWIAQFNPDGSNWRLIAAGFRNPFDIDFNEDGELFTFDSDMEWDLGLPWYRPTRINHVTSGADFGYREHDLKMAPEYPDNLPPVLNVGQGSPTNVMSGKDANFPEKYRKGIFTFDWSFGIIYHIDLKPQGSTYEAEVEEFISGDPLPLTDGVIGPDGAMYFLTGGRKLESNLYRVYYDGKDKIHTDKSLANSDGKESREIRNKLEEFQKNDGSENIDFAWEHLNDKDRFIRYAARIAIEHIPYTEWQDRALSEKDPVSSIHSLLALARNGDPDLRDDILKALVSINFKELENDQKIDLLRTIEVTLSRMGLPTDESVREGIVNNFDSDFPTFNVIEDRLLSKILVYTKDEKITNKVVDLLYASDDKYPEYRETATSSEDLIMRNPQYGYDIANTLANMPPEQKTFYAILLSEAEEGWTEDLKDRYFKWFFDSFSKYKGGRSFVGYLNEARKKALKMIPENKFAYYNELSGDSLLSERGNDLFSDLPEPEGKSFHNWEMEEVLAMVEDGLKNRDFDNGKKMFLAARCGTCHRFDGIGEGGIGPDLSQVGTRFSYHDMIESIIKPNASISDQYASTVFTMDDGSTVIGKLIKEDDGKYSISQNPYAPEDLREIDKKRVVSTKLSKVSMMPPGQINGLNEDEVKDLLAYLKSGGDPKDEVFK